MSVATIGEKIQELRNVINPRQILGIIAAVRGSSSGEEQAIEKLDVIYDRYVACPRTYETDGNKGKAVAQFRYFSGDSEFFITELDVSGPPHIQAYGYGSLNGVRPEMGYICIPELLNSGFDMDYKFEPKTLTELGLWKHD
jgi:hypothetical protein